MKAVVTLCLLLGALGAPSLGVPSAKSFGFSWPWTDVNKFAAENVQFELYTRENPESPERTRVCDLPVTLQYFVNSRPTKILIHGWGGVFQGVIDIKDAFLAKDDMNVVVVDWNEVDTFLYPVAAQRTKVVARQVGAFINFLVDTEEGPGLNLSDLHLVGHSLGAHIAGMSSLYVDGIIGRITGLDPASPLIADDPTSRLDKSDAAFVDVIHTSTNLFGWLAPLGHVDFYPNNGVAFQPNCMADDLKSAKCSHNFGYPLFNESILVDDAFLAQPAREPATYNLLTSPCKDQDIEGTPIFMGLSTPTSARGVYCLATRGESPYGYGPLAVLSSNFEATDLEIRAMKSLLSIG